MITAEVNYALSVDGRARFDAIEGPRNNISFAPAKVALQDVRPRNDALDLDVDGFRLFEHNSPIAVSGSRTELETVYVDEMAAFIKELTGAREVRPHRTGTLVRKGERALTEPPKDPNRLQQLLPPARFAHLDFTTNSNKAFIDLSIEDDGPIAPYRRMALYQTWRVTSEPPHESTLAVADPRSVAEEDVFEMDTRLGPEELPSCFFESRLCTVNPSHSWYYFPDMRPNEVLVFKGFDTDPDKISGVMHTAFDDPTAPADVIPRSSVEARFMAFFD